MPAVDAAATDAAVAEPEPTYRYYDWYRDELACQAAARLAASEHQDWTNWYCKGPLESSWGNTYYELYYTTDPVEGPDEGEEGPYN